MPSLPASSSWLHLTAIKRALTKTENLACISHQEKGGTGDSPVPSGDPPLGMGGTSNTPSAPSPTTRPAISSGQWPDGTGQWPVLPNVGEKCRLVSPVSSRAADLLRIAVVLLLAFITLAARSAETNQPIEQLRIFFSSRVLHGVQKDDARAAAKTWTQTVIRETGIRAEACSDVGTLDDAIAAFRDKGTHAASIPTDDYFKLNEQMKTTHLFFPMNNNSEFEEYVLLVHADSGITNLSNLKGRTVTFLLHHRMTLADKWLELTLAKHALPPANIFFGSVRQELKPAKVVLPVFFRSVDACVITRRGFELMTEMNPQVGANSRVLIASPKLVPNVLCFNSRVPSPFGERVRDGIRALHLSIVGQQMLTTFQLDRIVDASPDRLKSTREFVDDYERTCLATRESIVVPAKRLSARDPL